MSEGVETMLIMTLHATKTTRTPSLKEPTQALIVKIINFTWVNATERDMLVPNYRPYKRLVLLY